MRSQLSNSCSISLSQRLLLRRGACATNPTVAATSIRAIKYIMLVYKMSLHLFCILLFSESIRHLKRKYSLSLFYYFILWAAIRCQKLRIQFQMPPFPCLTLISDFSALKIKLWKVQSHLCVMADITLPNVISLRGVRNRTFPWIAFLALGYSSLIAGRGREDF